MTVRLPPKYTNGLSEVYTVDFRETAPAAAYPAMYPPGTNVSAYGGMSIAVPGELRGLEEAHKRWGSLPWKRVLQPIVDLAAGWEVDKELGIRIPVRKSVLLSSDTLTLPPSGFRTLCSTIRTGAASSLRTVFS